jgi:hypothetical protein
MSDDMYVCPEWDKHLMEEVMRHDTQLFFLSSTLIEPRVNGNVNALAPFYYGLSPDTFEETKLLSEYMNPRRDDWNGAYSVPYLIHRSTWDLVGGYSVELMPGFCADFDLAMKLYRAGVRSFKGVGKSRIYHFIAKPLIRLKKNDGHSQFLSKWGITTGVFHREYLKHGTPYRALPQFMEGKRIHRIRRWSKLLIAWSLLK